MLGVEQELRTSITLIFQAIWSRSDACRLISRKASRKSLGSLQGVLTRFENRVKRSFCCRAAGGRQSRRCRCRLSRQKQGSNQSCKILQEEKKQCKHPGPDCLCLELPTFCSIHLQLRLHYHCLAIHVTFDELLQQTLPSQRAWHAGRPFRNPQDQ